MRERKRKTGWGIEKMGKMPPVDGRPKSGRSTCGVRKCPTQQRTNGRSAR